MIDPLRLNPMFGWGAFTGSSKKIVVLNKSVYGLDKLIFEKSEEYEYVEVSFYLNGKEVGTVGGNEVTFVGFFDVDNDGKKDVFVNSISKRSKKGAFTITKTGSIIRIKDNTATRILYVLTFFLMQPFLTMFIGGGCTIISILFLCSKSSRRQRQ